MGRQIVWRNVVSFSLYFGEIAKPPQPPASAMTSQELSLGFLSVVNSMVKFLQFAGRGINGSHLSVTTILALPRMMPTKATWTSSPSSLKFSRQWRCPGNNDATFVD